MKLFNQWYGRQRNSWRPLLWSGPLTELSEIDPVKSWFNSNEPRMRFDFIFGKINPCPLIKNMSRKFQSLQWAWILTCAQPRNPENASNNILSMMRSRTAATELLQVRQEDLFAHHFFFVATLWFERHSGRQRRPVLSEQRLVSASVSTLGQLIEFEIGASNYVCTLKYVILTGEDHFDPPPHSLQFVPEIVH